MPWYVDECCMRGEGYEGLTSASIVMCCKLAMCWHGPPKPRNKIFSPPCFFSKQFCHSGGGRSDMKALVKGDSKHAGRRRAEGGGRSEAEAVVGNEWPLAWQWKPRVRMVGSLPLDAANISACMGGQPAESGA